MLAALLKLGMLSLIYSVPCRTWLGHVKQSHVLSAMIVRENFEMKIGYNKPVKIDFFMSLEVPQHRPRLVPVATNFGIVSSVLIKQRANP